MRNKKKIGVILVVFIVLGFFLGREMFDKKSTKNSSEKKVGILQYVSHPALDDIEKGIVKGLADSGFKENKNVKIILRNPQADQSKLKTMSEELIGNDSDVLVGIATPAAQALANQTKDIPIVLGAITDPVTAKLVKDEKKPGGNITGVSDKSPVSSQVLLVKKLLPKVRTVGILYSSSEDSSKSQVEEVKHTAKKQGIFVKEYAVASTNDINSVVNMAAQEVDCIYIPNDNTIASVMPTVVKIADDHKIPVIPVADTMVKEGGLATIALNQYELGVQTGRMVSQILKGKKPATMPIFSFKTGKVVINTKQTKKLGIEIPEDVLKVATKVN
ncbi:MAG: ABC transporter substrate-binding protein [Lactobacillales bacterium]|nr:ABC transporter substrate-binding protein [Lactobacillales bacterium]